SSYSSTVKRSTTKDAGEEPTKHPDFKKIDEEDQVFLDKLERLKRQEQDANDAAEALRKEFTQETEDLLLQAGAVKTSSTNIVNTGSTPVSTVDYPSLIQPILTKMTQKYLHLRTFIKILLMSYSHIKDYLYSSFNFNSWRPIISSSNKKQSDQKFWISCFFEPKKISEALEDKSWVDAMQKELLQFKIQKVWILVDLPYRKKAIGTKWVYRNKKDERGVVVRNKARIEAIKIFLAFASYMGFIVYQMDVKSSFLYGTIDEVYVSQPLGFVDPKIPKKVYKVVKLFYGLHQAPRAWYATLSTFLLKSGYRRGTINKTLFIKKDKNDIMLVQVYVDDIIFDSTKRSWCDEFEALMKSRFQMSSMRELTFFLGLQVKQK
ncbi:putative ribonuclease H-like domain-containing protein, partial [Tanacetum coccineum]